MVESYFILVGLDYFGVGFEYVWLYDIGWVFYELVIDVEVMDVFWLLCCIEGIILVIESVYVFVGVLCIGCDFGFSVVLFVNFFGCGDKDVDIVVCWFGFVDGGELVEVE